MIHGKESKQSHSSNKSLCMSQENTPNPAPFSSLFTKQADHYSASRPTYPPELYEHIRSYFGKANNTESDYSATIGLCLDVGAGSGQASNDLAKFCGKVIAVDPSEQQIQHAVATSENVAFMKGSAESLPASDGSVHLITVAQAAHWFDFDAFYKEVNRVLVPGGVLAMWGYGLNIFDHEKADAILKEYYSVTLDGYWSDRRLMLDNEYRDIIPPFPNSARVNLFMEKTMTMSEYITYLSSWSATTTYAKTNPNPLPALKEKFMDAFGFSSDQEKIHLKWPAFMILSHKPGKQ